MIADVLILPSLAAAMFRSGDAWHAVRLGVGGSLIECNRQLGLLWSQGRDSEVHYAGVLEPEPMLVELRATTAAHRALNFCLAGANPELSGENRRGSLRCAEELLASERSRCHVHHRLLGTIPPPDADFAGALDLAVSEQLAACAEIYRDFLRVAAAIRQVRNALEEVLYLDHAGEYDPKVAYLDTAPD